MSNEGSEERKSDGDRRSGHDEDEQRTIGGIRSQSVGGIGTRTRREELLSNRKGQIANILGNNETSAGRGTRSSQVGRTSHRYRSRIDVHSRTFATHRRHTGNAQEQRTRQGGTDGEARRRIETVQAKGETPDVRTSDESIGDEGGSSGRSQVGSRRSHRAGERADQG